MLHFACEHKAVQIARHLVRDEKVGPNAVSSDGMSPLMIAVRALSPEIIELLLDTEGIDIEYAFGGYGTALHQAC